MNIEYIEEAIRKIRECRHDDEVAHSMEDNLRQEFIEFVAGALPGDYSAMARLILTTNDIEFARWCA